MNPFEFVAKKSVWGAVIFYIVWLLIGMTLGALFAILILSNVSSLTNAFSVGRLIGNITAVIVSTVLAWLLLKERAMLKGTSLLFLLGTVVLAVLLGGLGGFIIPAYLTTRTKP